jgi:hypothetical protein
MWRLPLGAGGENHRPAAHRPADAVGGHVTGDVLHRVVDRQRIVDAAAGAVDVQVDVRGVVLVRQVEHPHDQRGGRLVVDLADEEQHPVFQQHLVDGHLAVALHAGRGSGRKQRIVGVDLPGLLLKNRKRISHCVFACA